MKGFRQAQRAYDNLTPEDFEAIDSEEREYDPTCFEMDEPDDTDWDAIDYGNFYDGTGR